MDSSQEDPAERASERQIAELFQAADYEVDVRLGKEPGSIVRLAWPKQGLVRPRTYWEVWPTCPASLDAALSTLEATRVSQSAERALGIVMEGSLPESYPPDLDQRPANAITLWRLVLELGGFADGLRELASIDSTDPAHPEQFIPRKAVTAEGNVVDASEYILTWIEQSDGQTLNIVAPAQGGKHTLIRHVLYRCARAFVEEPNNPRRIVVRGNSEGIGFSSLTSTIWRCLQRSGLLPGMFVFVKHGDLFSWVMNGMRCLNSIEPHSQRSAPYVRGRSEPLLPGEYEDRIELLAPAFDEVMSWYRNRLSSPAYAIASSMYERDRELAAFATYLPNVHGMAEALRATEAAGAEPSTWPAEVVVRFMGEALTKSMSDILDALESGALEQFVMGDSRRLSELVHSKSWAWSRQTFRSIWLRNDRAPQNDKQSAVLIPLMRDYFLARKIVSEVRVNRPELVLRHQFPNRVLMYLAVLAPDVVAQVTADRMEEMRAEIQSEVEYQVQLTLAHQLRRSAGALLSHMKRIRKHLPQEALQATTYELERMEHEIRFLSELAEQTRKWHQPPDGAKEPIGAQEAVSAVVRELGDGYPHVSVSIDIPPGTSVLASREGLHEILACVIENAFHAVTYQSSDRLPLAPAVTIRAYTRDRVVRIDILDNGPGVAEGDRQRIFEPRVTTKKGGEGQPQGTGMGLAIARRYAERLGGRVGLDDERAEQTCFYIEFLSGSASL